jgi:4-amino-4-deoxy-L-arabinose transferase-like glycosyltransferase
LALREGLDSLAELVYRQNVTRFLVPWDHERPWWYYLVYFWTDMAPWSFFLPLALRLPDRDDDERRLDRLAWIWIVGPIVFFSLSASKRSPYILPLAPAAAILAAGLAQRMLDGRLPAARRRNCLALLGVIGVLLVAGAFYGQLEIIDRFPQARPPLQATIGLLLAGGAAMLAAIGVATMRCRAAAAALMAFVILLYALAASWVLPAVNELKSSRPFCEAVNRHASAEEPLHAYRLWRWRGGYAYYTGRPVRLLDDLDELRRHWARTDRVFLIVERGMLREAREVIGNVEPLVDRPVGSNHAYLFSNR